jgi:hypothetical protein
MPVCPALPPPDTTTGYGRSAFITRRSRYFAGAVGGGIQYSIRRGGICALRLGGRERETNPSTNQPTPLIILRLGDCDAKGAQRTALALGSKSFFFLSLSLTHPGIHHHHHNQKSADSRCMTNF